MTQDPLENTISDFWRMIVEQNVRTIVMFSEVGEENCPRYWPEKDQETPHDYIKVKYMQSQSFPFYYKREFTVTNSKTEDSYLVTQFQYNGWPIGAGEVPESTRGLVELVDTTLKHQESIEINTGPSIVHCRCVCAQGFFWPFIHFSSLFHFAVTEPSEVVYLWL